MGTHPNLSQAQVKPPGAILIDGILQAFGLGVIICQAGKYFGRYKEDPRFLRIYVGILSFLAVIQTVLQEYKVWRQLIQSKTWASSPMQWSDIFLNGFICFVCQGFFIHRCYKVIKKSVVAIAPLWLLWIAIFIADIYLAVAVQKTVQLIPSWDTASRGSRYVGPSTLVPYSFWTFGSLVLDTTMTVILVVCLWRSRTGAKDSNRVVLRIIAITWESALLPSISMAVAVSMYHSTPDLYNPLVTFFVLLTGKLYTIGLLRTLNSRTRFRASMKAVDVGQTTLERWQWEDQREVGLTHDTGLQSTVSPESIPTTRAQGSFSTTLTVIERRESEGDTSDTEVQTQMTSTGNVDSNVDLEKA